ncbi:MAG: chromosome segregation protein SMC [Candidatus Caenarcaniphilales bacterium]|nr:chromosome segregation protein SMC [Candidatus Caenarcaniphilales bacterium]
MYIESIELDNFKSFGEKTFIPFFPGFTTISGPNGSGKSNIIDSLLFAFGLSTNKTMRAERLTDLMNNLSGKKETTVQVVLYDEKTETQLKIARRIRLKLSGQYESNYFINSKPATLSEIHDQLAIRSISPNAYNVVMQGDVTRIISMSALERRRIIDELAGVAEFDRKIEEAKQEIGQATMSLDQQTILLTEFSDRLEILKKERDQALKYIELKKQRNYLERLFRQARIQELEQKQQQVKTEIESKLQEKTNLMEHLGDVTESFDSVEVKLKDIQLQLDKLSKDDRGNLQSKLDLAREKAAKEESGIEFLNKQIIDYQNQAQRIVKESRMGEKKISELDLEVRKYVQQEDSIKKELDSINSNYQSTQSKILEKSQNDNLSAGKVLEIQALINELQEAKSKLSTEKALSEQNLARAEQEIVKLRTELEASLRELKEMESRSKNSKSELLSGKIANSTSYLRKLKQELSDTEQELKDRTGQLYAYQNELSKLEMKKEVAHEHHWGRAIDLILNSGMNGIHGVLAQLAKVAPDYTLALEVAAGSRLKSIVVDDDSVGARLIEFLRSRNAGRATFLPLNKLRPASQDSLPPEAKLQGSGIIGWAVDLVRCDDIYLPAFGYSLGNTLVIKDIPSGRRYMGRYRMVTLKGDLLEKSGAMTGGSNPRESGLHFGKEDNAKAEELARQVESVQKRIVILKNLINDLKNEVSQTEEELDGIKAEWARSRANEEMDGKGVKNLHQLVETNKARLTSLAQERDRLEQRIRQAGFEIKDIEKQLLKTSDLLAREGARVRDSGLEALINQSQELEYERKKLEVNLRNLESSKAEFAKNIESIRGGIVRGEEEIIQAQAQIEQLKIQVAQQEKSLIESKRLVDEFEKLYFELQKQIDLLDKEKEKYSSELLQLAQKKTETSESLKRISQELADRKAKLLDLEERLTSLRQEVLSSEIKDLEEQDIEEELKRHSQNMTQDQVRQELDKIERKMTALEPVNMKAIDEFNEVFDRLNEIKTRCEGLVAEKEEIERRISSYSEHKLKSFFEAYNDVNKHFKEIFAELSFGQGELFLENQEDPFKGGLIIQARPRNKKMQRLESMSGGEKSLTALSFIFALQWHNPAPFYAFDEVDMFLDGLNAERLSKMVKKQSTLAQFIVVSLRKPMIQASERALGVFLGKDGFSKVAGMKSKEIENVKANHEKHQESIEDTSSKEALARA